MQSLLLPPVTERRVVVVVELLISLPVLACSGRPWSRPHKGGDSENPVHLPRESNRRQNPSPSPSMTHPKSKKDTKMANVFYFSANLTKLYFPLKQMGHFSPVHVSLSYRGEIERCNSIRLLSKTRNKWRVPGIVNLFHKRLLGFRYVPYVRNHWLVLGRPASSSRRHCPQLVSHERHLSPPGRATGFHFQIGVYVNKTRVGRINAKTLDFVLLYIYGTDSDWLSQ